ncbi:flagellin N-terminal helical domain-containing protein
MNINHFYRFDLPFVNQQPLSLAAQGCMTRLFSRSFLPIVSFLAIMTSLVTNTSAAVALQTLRSVGSSLQDTQIRVSSGLRVQKASDNAAYWSIATTMRSDNLAIGAVSETLGVTQSLFSVTYEALETVIDEISTIKSLLVHAADLPDFSDANPYDSFAERDRFLADFEKSPLGKISSEIDQHLAQILTAANSASFNGLNLLVNPVGGRDQTVPWEYPVSYSNGGVLMNGLDVKDVTLFNLDLGQYYDPGDPTEWIAQTGIIDGAFSSYVNTDAGTDWNINSHLITGAHIDPYYNSGSTVEQMGTQNFLLGIEYVGHGGGSSATIDRARVYSEMMAGVDEIQKKIITAASIVGSAQKGLDMASDHLSRLTDANDRGIGRLVDADMEQESSRLAALQTQQQLAVQSLSIANSSPQTILTLFQ